MGSWSLINPMEDQISDLKLNDKTLQLFKKLGINRKTDLLLHFPYRYLDETKITSIASLKVGEGSLIEGEIVSNEVQYFPRKMLILGLRDETGIISCRFLNFYKSQVEQFAVGRKVRFYGEPKIAYAGLEIIHPKYHPVVNIEPNEQTLTPIYSTLAGLTQKTIKKTVDKLFANLPIDLQEDTIPSSIIKKFHLTSFINAIETLHFPPSETDIDQLANKKHVACQRIIFDELLAQQISMRIIYHQRQQKKAPLLKGNKIKLDKFINQLSFKLTAAQQRVLNEILADLSKEHPMHRLLQGDVGSGKTIVATLSCLHSIYSNYQATLMAPTEILAEQHFSKIERWLTPLGIRTQWLTGSMKKKEKEIAYQKIANHDVDLIIGTHALIQEEVQFNRLGLAIIDEQHRFGVEQRLALKNKTLARNNFEPHLLMMSATPIPRTLSMSYFADLDVSIIDELPLGRQPIITKLINNDRRDEILERIRTTCLTGKQAYWVCPLIEESEKLQLETAVDTFNYIQHCFPGLSVSLIHGRMDRLEKQSIMEKFHNNQIQILVATTVIEVGVDVPNATTIVIDHAERMGLAQLHQLRGRVGRGGDQGTCILLYHHPIGDNAKKRLKIIYECLDGFELAKQDLLIRGPGEVLGAKQSGLPSFRYANLIEHADIIPIAQNVADEMIALHPNLALKHVQRWLGSFKEYWKA